jgi:hypothetical protein
MRDVFVSKGAYFNKLVIHITAKKCDLEVRAIQLETRTYSVIVLSLCSAPEAEV